MCDHDELVCRVCGCTDDRGCPGGCYWVEDDLCSQCAEFLEEEDADELYEEEMGLSIEPGQVLISMSEGVIYRHDEGGEVVAVPMEVSHENGMIVTREAVKPCECGHAVELGACKTFEAGMNGRCVYCDHAAACHPGAGPWANGPLGPILVDAHTGPNRHERRRMAALARRAKRRETT